MKVALTLSVIIPCWNDAAALASLLETLHSRHGVAEIFVADASTGAECRIIAERFGAHVVNCGQPNRGAQMNAGAALASSEALLFQHADTELTQAHVDSLLSALADDAVAGGAFHRRFDERHPRMRWLEGWNRLLAKSTPIFGDQSIFVRRAVFQTLGGFAEIPLMEDLEFSRRLRRAGVVKVIDPPIASSARDHLRHGSWKITARNASIIALYCLGISPHRLHAWYYRERRRREERPA